MSEENHPNFHAVKFSIKIIDAIENCLRNDGLKMRKHVAGSLGMVELITNFTFDIENKIDRIVGTPEPQPKE